MPWHVMCMLSSPCRSIWQGWLSARAGPACPGDRSFERRWRLAISPGSSGTRQPPASPPAPRRQGFHAPPEPCCRAPRLKKGGGGGGRPPGRADSGMRVPEPRPPGRSPGYHPRWSLGAPRVRCSAAPGSVFPRQPQLRRRPGAGCGPVLSSHGENPAPTAPPDGCEETNAS